MKMKGFSLLIVLVFATIATYTIFTLAAPQTAKTSIDLAVRYSTHVNDGGFVKPQGDPIDSPGGPTITPGPP
jgi:hypothetical protein